MQWSNRDPEQGGKPQKPVPATNSNVLKSNIVAESVMEFVPQQFIIGTPSQALDYLARKTEGADFRMSDPTRMQTGLDDIEQQNVEAHVESLVLERLKSVQEEAYKQAYQLGLDEGKADALRKHSSQITESLESLGTLLGTLENLKKELVANNESHLVQLLFSMSSRLAGAQLQADPAGLVNIIKSAVELAQDEENVKIHLAPSQVEFIETMKKNTGREFEFLKHLQLEPDESVNVGGCIIETNYGEVDARMEQRVSKLWETMADNLPRTKDRVEG